MGKNVNMQQGSLWDKLLWYAVPLAMTGILQQLFHAADIAVLGRFVGTDAMAAVGSNSPLINLLLNSSVGISLGTNVVIANGIGKNDAIVIQKAVHTSIIISVICGSVMLCMGECIAVPALRLMNVPPEVFDFAVLYFRVYMAGMPVILLYNFTAAIYRSEGNTRMPLVVLVISGVLNIVLNLFFVVGLERTVDGVAAATVISNLVSAVILIAGLMKSDHETRFQWSALKIDQNVLRQIIKIGVPAGIQGMAPPIANLVIQTSINNLGAVVMAGSSASHNLELFVYFILNAYGQTCTTFVGQNYGAGKRGRCNRTLFLCLGECILFVAVTCALILFFGKTLLSLFNGEPDVIEAGYVRLIYVCAGFCFTLIVEVLSGYLRGYGLSLIPAVTSVIGVSGVRIVWIYTVFRKNPSFSCIMFA